MKTPTTTRVEMVWEDPGPKRNSVGVAADIAEELEELRANPQRWAQLRVWTDGEPRGKGSSVANWLRKGRPDYEFAGRRLPGGSALYARYIGSGETP